MIDGRACECLAPQFENRRWGGLRLHDDRQDTGCDPWKRLLDLVERAADDGREEIVLGRDLGWDSLPKIVTLPPSIAKLKAVKRLVLYGSHLVRVPPEVGEMSALEYFDPYTSYRLHWFPYEITRCRRLDDSRVSTRALYGNFKYRPPFPRLPQRLDAATPAGCSVCGGPFTGFGPHQFWVSLPVGTDVLPLLVHACSGRCVLALPTPPDGYVPEPHEGGLGLEQPPVDEFYR